MRAVRVSMLLRLVLCTCVALSLCAPRLVRAAEPLQVWHAYRDDEKAALDQVLRAYEKANPGVRVEALQVPHDAYKSKLSAAVPRGHGPHLFIESHEVLGDFEQRGIVHALVEVDRAPFLPRALEALEHEGKLRGLPLALKSVALFTNTALVPEVPATMEGIVALQQSLPKGVFPLAYEASNMYVHAAILHAFGGRQLGPDGGLGFASPEGERSLALVRGWIDARAIPAEADGALVEKLFAAGKAAAVISGPWFAANIPKAVPYRVTPLPQLAAAGARLTPYLTVEAAVLTPKGALDSRARKLLDYVAGADSAAVRARVGRQVVARRELPPGAQSPLVVAFHEQAKMAIVMPSSARMRATWEPSTRALKKVVNTGVPARSALDEARRRFEDILRPPPPPTSSTPLVLVVGVMCLFGAFRLFRQREDLVPALKQSMPAYRWVAHAVIAVGVLVILPIVVGAGISLYAGQVGDLHYVGVANFIAILTARGAPLLSSGSFYLVLLVTVAWTLANIVLHVVIGFTLGLLLSRPRLALKPIYRVLLIVPWAVPSYVTALAWKGMFNRQFGAVSALLELVGVEPISWWAQFSTAFSANVATNVWLGFPFMMVVTMGALTAVPKEVLEAADVDGATRFQRLWRVVVPMVVPTMLPAVLLGAIWTFNMFNVVFLVSGGGPDGTTDILVSEAYRWAFTRQAQYGYAAAYSVLIFLLLAMMTRVMARLGSPKAPA